MPEPRFPYDSFRPGQREVAEQVSSTVREGGVLLLQAPTGFGKTAAVIYGLLLAGAERVLYVVRTRNEIQPVVRELTRFGASFTFLFSARRMCPLFRQGDEEQSIEDFWENCRLARLRGVCRYYANLDTVSRETLRSVVSSSEPDPFLVVELLASYKLCPFFALKMLVDDSTFVVATYPYLFNPDIFSSVFEPREYSDFVVVVDEAHSLMEAHTMLEKRVSLPDLEKALAEVASRYGEGSEYYRRLRRLRDLVSRAPRDPAPIEPRKLLDILGDPEEWRDIALEIRSERIVEALDTGDTSKVVVYTSRVAAAAEALAAGFRAYLARNGGRPALKLLPLDPCTVTDQPLNASRAAVLMSGTMPPASYFRDVLCVRKQVRVYDVELFHASVAAEYARGRRVLVAAEPTSRYTERGERMYELYAAYLEKTMSIVKGVVLAVFPSYEFMENVLRRLSERARDSMVVETQGTTLTEVVKALGTGTVKAIAAVAGGKLVEGVEYVDSEGRSVVTTVFVAGVPYPQPDRIFLDYLNHLASKLGEEQARHYAYNVTAAVKVRQAIGRAQRRPGDRVVAVLADRRFLYRRIRELLRLRYDRVVFSLESYARALEGLARELGLA